MKIPLMQGWLRNQRYLNLAMDLSSTCDIQCVECFRNFVEPPPAKVSLDQIRVLETQVFPYLKGLALSCTGEPLYLKTFPEALGAAKRAGVPFVRIQTNGTHLDEARREMLIDKGLDSLGVSLDASTPETFEKIRFGAKWDTVVPNIREMVRLRNSRGSTKPRVALNFALMKQNAEEAVDFIRLGLELGVDSIAFSHLIIESWEMRDWSLMYDRVGMNRLLASLREEAAKTRLSILVPDDLPGDVVLYDGELREEVHYRGQCGAAREPWAFLLPTGDLFVCANLRDRGPLGNVFETPFPKIWYGQGNQETRKEALRGSVPGCDQCKILFGTADPLNEMSYLAKRLTTKGAAAHDLRYPARKASEGPEPIEKQAVAG